MKSLFTLFCISIFTLNFSQAPEEETNKLGDNPIFLIDSVKVNNSAIQNYDPKEIASLSIYRDGEAISLRPEDGKDGVVYIETKKFSKKRFQNYFKTKSSEYKKIITQESDDNELQYILNGKILIENFEGDLASINDKVFKSLKVIHKNELQKKFKIEDKEYGIVIVADESKKSEPAR